MKRFCVHPKLQKVARSHSRDIIERAYFSTTPRLAKPSTRLRSFGCDPSGYSYYATGENSAYGSCPYGEPGSRMDARMKSDGHRRRNILDDEFREIGVGSHAGTYGDTERVTMYTAGLGVRRR